ncbi:MAG TPA: hypothetical protein PKD00_01435 [Burkholderiales bacterium]|nr:hypothetical protein [Burkholderiales bacterium]
MNIKINLLKDNALVPLRATEFAGGWDVVATEIVQVEKDFVICKLGFSLQPPSNFKVTLVPRSSITKTKWVMTNSPGLIDPDFTGEVSMRFRCIPQYKSIFNPCYYEKFPYKVGERVGQLYVESIIPIEWKITNNLTNHNRLPEGFGTTNK